MGSQPRCEAKLSGREEDEFAVCLKHSNTQDSKEVCCLLAYVLNKKGKPIMPCNPAKARKLLDSGKAKVVSRVPFTIKLLHGSSGYTQPVIAGMDTGSKHIGCHSEKKMPVRKLFGLKKHDLVKTPQGTGLVKGKRSSGYFALETILGEKVHASANIKKNTVRLSARTTTLTQLMEAAIPLDTKVPSILAVN